MIILRTRVPSSSINCECNRAACIFESSGAASWYLLVDYLCISLPSIFVSVRRASCIHYLVICMQSECSLSNGKRSIEGDGDSAADEDEESIRPAQLVAVLDSDSGLRFRNCLRVIYANQLPTASALSLSLFLSLSLSLLCLCCVFGSIPITFQHQSINQFWRCLKRFHGSGQLINATMPAAQRECCCCPDATPPTRGYII